MQWNAVEVGSPPRMRGKGKSVKKGEKALRITPAYAGKRGQSKSRQAIHEDHPRVCGEKGISYFSGAVVSGSPPRMRGKVFFHHRDALGKRITPAYAGKRKPFWYDLNQQRDHPRVCGEKWTTAGRSPPPRGSPPRMRGKVHAAQSRAALHGITPAYAGKRDIDDIILRGGEDHPRVCGEKLCRRHRCRQT